MNGLHKTEKKHKNPKHGFTLIEILVALVAFGILSLTVGLMLVHGWSSWHKSNEWVGWQRDSVLIQKVITKRIRESRRADIDAAENKITFAANPIRDSEESIICQDGDLILNRNGGTFVLAKGSVEKLEPAVTGDEYIEVTLHYDGPLSGKTEEHSFSVYFRNE